MKPFSTNHRGTAGFTLLEMLVTVMVLATVVTGLCDVFLTVEREWDRQSSQSTAFIATDAACSAIDTYVQNAMEVKVFTRFTTNDTLVVCLPSNKAYGVYVPANPTWSYHRGANVVFYLSNSSGRYDRNGSILWAATYAGWYRIPSLAVVLPDSEWSLYPDSTIGRIAPITSVAFTKVSEVKYSRLDITVSASYSTPGGAASLIQTKSICPRSQMY